MSSERSKGSPLDDLINRDDLADYLSGQDLPARERFCELA